jgi:hypothetical protein
MTPLELIGVFVGIPLGVLLLIVLAVSAPSRVRDGRYRPGVPWAAEPVWFNGPGDPTSRSTGAGRRSVGGAGGSW